MTSRELVAELLDRWDTMTPAQRIGTMEHHLGATVAVAPRARPVPDPLDDDDVADLVNEALGRCCSLERTCTWHDGFLSGIAAYTDVLDLRRARLHGDPA